MQLTLSQALSRLQSRTPQRLAISCSKREQSAKPSNSQSDQRNQTSPGGQSYAEPTRSLTASSNKWIECCTTDSRYPLSSDRNCETGFRDMLALIHYLRPNVGQVLCKPGNCTLRAPLIPLRQ